MNYIKKFGLKGCLFLAKGKLEGFKKSIPTVKVTRLPLLSAEPVPVISVVIYGSGDREASLSTLRNQKYPCFEIADLADAKGDYIAFLPAGDRLKENALYLMMEKLLRCSADAVYCDEEDFYKPDWSPDTLNSCDYIGFFIIKKGLLRDFREPLDLLRDSEYLTVAHCPRPLAVSSRELIFYNEEIKPVQGKVSIIIPSKDNYDVLKVCIDSIREKTTRSDYEIIVVDNGSIQENAEKYRALADKYIYEKRYFNFSYMCNRGAQAAEGSFLLFLNDDTEVIAPDWLDKMAYYAAKPHSGAVGAKLYYPNTKTIQHCGVINIQPGPAHAFLGEDDEAVLYKGRNRGVWNYTAVTAACLMIEKSKFSGFDEDFRVAYNDVELCMSLIERGYYNMVINAVTLYHYESLSRGDDRLNREKLKRLALEKEILFARHPQFCGRDNFYNINLSPYRVDFIPRNFAVFESCRKFKLINNIPQGENFDYKIEYAISGDMVRISGYACKKGYDRIYVLLEGIGGIYRLNTVREMRTDIEAVKGRAALLGGFNLMLENTYLPKGKYKVGVMLTDIFGIMRTAVLSDNTVEFL